jgi:hypothetical protein
MAPRQQLQSLLESMTEHVYFQPPPNLQMSIRASCTHGFQQIRSTLITRPIDSPSDIGDGHRSRSRQLHPRPGCRCYPCALT